MRLSESPSRPPTRGFTLIEVLCYLAVIGLVTSMAMATLFQLIRQSSALQRNCEEIAAAVRAGEIWRADIRLVSRTGGISESADRLVLPTDGQPVIYSVRDGAVWRQAGVDAPAEAILRGVKSSRFASAPRKSVTAWLWEVELETTARSGPTRPLFSFTAVPAGRATP
jgi:prepilin-type N-terminal cleavage/methylation domain-containing protein